MDPRRLVFPVFEVREGAPDRLRGNAFPVSPRGHLVTCKHVVDSAPGTKLALGDLEQKKLHEVPAPIYGSDAGLDLALLPDAVGHGRLQLPTLEQGTLRVGSDVYTYGHYSPSGIIETAEDGMFKGHVVRFKRDEHGVETLSYPVIEGLSGSPVLTYHNGVKLAGVCFGSESKRVIASEIVHEKNGENSHTETVTRIVEFGLAYRVEELIRFLEEVGFADDLIITADRVDNPELG